MCFIINDVDKASAIEVDVCGIIAVPQDYNLSDSNVMVKLVGKMDFADGLWVLNAQLSADVSFSCDRCLTPFNSSVKSEVIERFSDADEQIAKEIDDEVWHFSSKTIDLTPVIRELLLLSMPLRAVCDEDCKGLCPVCGQNLNFGECGCENIHANPKFEILRSLFQDKEV